MKAFCRRMYVTIELNTKLLSKEILSTYIEALCQREQEELIEWHSVL